MAERIWITWEIQRRNRTLSFKLRVNLYEVTAKGPRWKRYPVLIIKTLKIIFERKPTLLFVQNPSLLLAALAVFYGKIRCTTVIVDAHNGGIFPFEGKSKVLNKIAEIVNSQSDKVIVSNSALKIFINKSEGDVFVIPDPIPVITKHSEFPLSQARFNLVFICSWAADEPYEEVLRVAENVSDIVHIYITGNSQNKEKYLCNTLPKNVTLTGFLPEQKYEDLLVACDALMILTKRDNCLVCGAYEGVAVEKPMIISKTDAMVNHFNKGCMCTDNSGPDIEKSIRRVIDKYDDLVLEIKTLKKEQESQMDLILNEFNRFLYD